MARHRGGRPNHDWTRKALAVTAGIGLFGVLAACGGGNTIEAGAVLAEGARADLIGAPRPTQTDPAEDGEAVPARAVAVDTASGAALPVASSRVDVPARVLGTASLEDFLFQTAEVARQADVNAFGPCRERHIAARGNVFDRVVDPGLAVFVRDGATGAYRTSVFVEGCGAPRRHNLLVVPFEARETIFLPLLPGTSRAGLSVQTATTRQVFQSVETTAGRGCLDDGNLRVRTTRTLGATDGSAWRRDAPWRETWTVHFCGRDYAADLVFDPQPDGTRATVQSGRTRIVDLGWPQP